jgi:Fe2+ or Zn2+ uptake regulation protein
MAVTGSDRVFASALSVAHDYRTFTATEVETFCEKVWGEDRPSRRTIYSHLDALVEIGVLEEIGERNTLRRFRFVEQFDPSS